jgi:catechol 2,3-dioxygenase-like lactoylglutathione lyase family enzyme
VDYKLEVVVVPVSDVDRAKAFYTEQVGFVLDVDHRAGESFRVVQMTPPGSACSVTIGTGVGGAVPGSSKGMQLSVSDIELAHTELSARGVPVSDIQHFVDGTPTPGPHPQRERFGSFVFFDDPDGNSWAVQEVR